MLKNHTILYVEDEIAIQKSIAQLLRTYFKKVFVVSDGEEALKLFKNHQPDALLLDINLPKVTGIEMAKQVRKTHSDMPIVMLTAYTDEDKLLNAIDLNIKKYLIKPLKHKEFKDALTKIATHFLKHSTDILQLGTAYIWHMEEQVLYHKEKAIPLSSKEHILFNLLALHQHDCVTHESIMAVVWEDHFEEEITFASVKNLVKNLRKKLPGLTIESIYGRGYTLH